MSPQRTQRAQRGIAAGIGWHCSGMRMGWGRWSGGTVISILDPITLDPITLTLDAPALLHRRAVPGVSLPSTPG